MRGIPPIVIVLAAVLGLSGLLLVGGAALFIGKAWFGVPFFSNGPVQPIGFPHTVHAGTVDNGGLGLECSFCHRNVDKGASATVPSVEQCMFCHSQVVGTTETAQAEISLLRSKADLGEPIDWVRVHRLPDHVQFVHDAHIRYFTENNGMSTKQVCSTCHGSVETMTQVKPVRSLKMGDCVDCHRENSAPTDCATCHY